MCCNVYTLINYIFFLNCAGELEGIPALVSSLGPGERDQLLSLCSAKAGDLILFAVGDHAAVNKTLDRLRLFAAHQMGLIDNVSILSFFYSPWEEEISYVLLFL